MFIWNICDGIWRINKKGLGAIIKLTQSFLFERWFYSLSMILLSFGSRRLITFVTSALPIIK